MAINRTNPNYMEFHKSVSQELYSVKDRIRNLVTHWPSDGEAKEVALRSVLRRHLPSSVLVGRGFIVTSEHSSTQIDILIVDANKPTLFRDGDLLIVTPDAVRGVIEVKTRVNTQPDMTDVLTKLSKIEEMCRDSTGRDSVWTGLFIFDENSIAPERSLLSLTQAYQATARPINCISSGRNTFIRYWERGRDIRSPEKGPVWHAYNLPEVAPSYFMGNLIDWIGSIENSSAGFAWFPAIGGKEQYITHYMPLNANNPTAV